MQRPIALLPPHVIDQIAAGEVVERPASVVKELVDNALDAGARTITVETQAGGRALIRVSDDGRGMTADEARLALQRHATSKLTSVDDLWSLDTMGFRGEALPAIASVATLTLTTRPHGAIAATRIVVTAGTVTDVSEVGAPLGTTIEVADLFANVPARLKFLKGDATEASHITDLVARLAMSHPSLHLRLKHNGRTALEVPPDRDGFSRAQALLGSRIGARMIEVSGEEDGVRVIAYLGAPELAQATARGVQLFVGRRPVRDRGLLHAIAMGYGELIPRGRYPIAVVQVDVPAGAVDVNVHPQKQEVRFSDAALVAAAVRHVVQAGVGSASWRAELGGPLQMTALTSIAPPRLPLDGTPATPLSQRYAQSLREQMEWRPG
ncbi:MAG TPA: DNA mismatch repair endonuclease MutL, partial [Kofleriaceae bacterium]